jgi:hypothetical protein
MMLALAPALDVGGGAVLLTAALLGARHATDPDHLAAVISLVASRGGRPARDAGKLGLAWGAGHAVTFAGLGVPLVVLRTHLPGHLHLAAEVAVAVVIVLLAVRLLRRWRRGELDLRATGVHELRPPRPARPLLRGFAIGLLHGTAGSAAVSALVVANGTSTHLAVASLVLLAASCAVSMAAISSGCGFTLGRRRARARFGVVAPLLGVASLAFGVWYGLGALGVVPYGL